MKKIILASVSPRRKELLTQIGLKFEVEKSGYEENIDVSLNPRQLAKFLSREKAKDVSGKHKNAIIIAADTFAILNGEIIGKPKTGKEAKTILKKLSGKMHRVITGFTLMDRTSLVCLGRKS